MIEETNKEMLKELRKDICTLRYRTNLILSGIRNILLYDNPKGVNDHMIKLIEREL